MIRDTIAADYTDIPVFTPQAPTVVDHRTVVVGDTAVAVYGFSIPAPGVGHCWVTPGERAERFALAIVRAGQLLADEAFRTYDIRRLQTTAPARDPRMWRMMELVGFHPESVMSQAAPDGGDAIMYAMFRRN